MFSLQSGLVALLVIMTSSAVFASSAMAGAAASASSSGGGGYGGGYGNDYVDYVEEVSGSFSLPTTFVSPQLALLAAGLSLLAWVVASGFFGLVGVLPTGVFGNGPAPWGTGVLTGFTIAALCLLFLGLVGAVVVFIVSFMNY